MRKPLFIFIILLTAEAGMLAQENCMVVPGRIWWYESYKVVQGWNQVETIFGIKIGDSEEDNPEWYPCIAIDSDEKEAMSVPLAWLKEEKRKVMVRPNLHIYEYESDKASKTTELISEFLGYWYGDDLRMLSAVCGVENETWNPEGLEEFLLYDFNYGIGDQYDWPWTGMYVEGPMADTELKKGLDIDSIEEISYDCNGSLVVSQVYILKQGGGGKLELMENIGPVNGSIQSYLLHLDQWPGFFFAPAAYTNRGDEAHIDFYARTPVLVSVKDSERNVLYCKAEYDEAAEINSVETGSIPDSTLYDLYGRRICNPLPGTVYIRGGKKFVAK